MRAGTWGAIGTGVRGEPGFVSIAASATASSLASANRAAGSRATALAAIAAKHATIDARLDAYQRLFANVLRDGHRLCMCGMLAADFDALPANVRREVRAFFDDNELWLAKIFADAKRPRPKLSARVVLSAFEGAMLVARAYGDVGRFEAVARSVVAQLMRDDD